MPINVGIIGLGWAGQTHAKHFAELGDVSVVAGADLDATRAKSFAEAHGARTYSGFAEMLEVEDALDAVVLATDASVRLEPIRAICDRKLALFCEKPPALDVTTARAIKEVIESAGSINTVGFQTRWAPAAERMRQLLAGRRPLFAQITIAWPVFDWVAKGLAPRRLYTKAGCGGPMIEQGIHYQDALRYITGDEPVRVQAMAELGGTEPRRGRNCEETTAVLVRHASGMLSTHVHNWSYTGVLHHIQVVGADFELTWRISDGDRIVGTVDGKEFEEQPQADPYVEELRGFAAAVARRDASMVRSPYSDACRTLAVCEAATKAIDTGTVQLVESI